MTIPGFGGDEIKCYKKPVRVSVSKPGVSCRQDSCVFDHLHLVAFFGV